MSASTHNPSNYESQRLREFHRLMDELDCDARRRDAEAKRELDRVDQVNRREAIKSQRRTPGPMERNPAVKRHSPAPDDPARWT